MSTVEQAKSTAVRGPEPVSQDGAGWWGSARLFLSDARNEMRRVTWPGRREVYATTVVVILTSAFFGLYLWGLDLIFNWAVSWVFRTLGAA